MIPCLTFSLAGSDIRPSPAAGAAPADNAAKAAEAPVSPQQLREEHQQLLHAIELVRRDADAHLQRYSAAVDRIRKDSEASVQRFAASADANTERLKQTFSSERERELQVLQRSNRVALTTASVLVGVALLGMLLTAWMLLRAVNQLAGRMAWCLSGPTPLPDSRPVWDTHVLFGTVAPENNPGLQGALERLERRLIELEHASGPAPASALPASRASNPQAGPRAASAKTTKASGVSLTVGEGQALIFLPREERIPPFAALRHGLHKLWKRSPLARATRDEHC